MIEFYKRFESRVEETLDEMDSASVPVRRVEDSTKALREIRVRSSTVHELDQKIDGRIGSHRTWHIDGESVYIAVAKNLAQMPRPKFHNLVDKDHDGQHMRPEPTI